MDFFMYVTRFAKNPLPGYNFYLTVEAGYDLPCKSVRPINIELEYEQVAEGGLNDYVHMLRKPITKPKLLEIERYACTDVMLLDPLKPGTEFLLPVMLNVFTHMEYTNNGYMGATRTFLFTGCKVIKRVYGALESNKSDLVVDTITLAFNNMLCIDLSDVS